MRNRVTGREEHMEKEVDTNMGLLVGSGLGNSQCATNMKPTPERLSLRLEGWGRREGMGEVISSTCSTGPNEEETQRTQTLGQKQERRSH